MDVQQLERINIPVGSTVRVSQGGADKRKTMIGTVIACNARHFTVQGPHYADSYLKVDLGGLVLLTELKGKSIVKSSGDGACFGSEGRGDLETVLMDSHGEFLGIARSITPT